MDILNIENYSDARQFFFKELTSKLTDAIQSSDYSVEQPLDKLLKSLMIKCYFVTFGKMLTKELMSLTNMIKDENL